MLQQTLAAGTSVSALIGDSQVTGTHHPITCQDDLHFEEDGTFACPHSVAPPGESRTQQCLDSSIAILILELAVKNL